MNFEEAFDKASEISFDRFSFEQPDYDMLIVNDETDYLEHLRVQAAGMAYYTALSKLADRKYEEYDRRFKFRYNEMYSDCSNRLLAEGKKNNVKDIESFVQIKYEAELKKMYAKLDELRENRDYIAAFLEGWKQKSYVLSSMTNMVTAGLLTPREVITENDMQSHAKAKNGSDESSSTAREILRLVRKKDN